MDEKEINIKYVMVIVICLVVGFVSGKVSNDNIYIGCQPRNITEAMEYINYRLDNLDDYTTYSNLPFSSYVDSFVSTNMTFSILKSNCDLFPYVCEDIIKYELKRLCYDIQ